MFNRPWAAWRRVQYMLGLASFLGLVSLLVYFTGYYVPPNCFDSSANADESGVDCGGGCVRICAASVLPPRLVWAESFQVAPGQYNAVAYIDNANQIAGAPTVDYIFSFFDGEELVQERPGTISLPPNSVYPIFEGRIFLSEGETITHTELQLNPVELWLPASVDRDKFQTGDINFSDVNDKPKLAVEMQNNSLEPAENVEVVATIFTEDGLPVTASQTIIEYAAPRDSQNVTFTWPNPITKTVRSCIIPTDVVMAIDLSGSMNNDGDTPPQPVTDTLSAASKFAQSLKSRDQIALVTFASNASLVASLSQDNQAVAETIAQLTIDPLEETGFTNTLAALSLAGAEFDSGRQNSNARKVLVLLTDGLPTTEGDEDIISRAVDQALVLDESGIEIYAIGLGEGADRQFVQRLASDESNAFFAPSSADLESIYQEITTSLCESGATKIEVIAKTEAVFTPLR